MRIHISQTTREFLPSNYKVSERGDIDVKGKGSMKSFWLEHRENRTPLAQVKQSMFKKTASPVKAIEQPEHIQDRRLSMPPYGIQSPGENTSAGTEDRRVYSPVTFEDVARRSIVNSPARNIFSARGRMSRSNSTGHNYLQSPSDVFGALITDTEEFFEDLHQRSSTANSMYSPMASPCSQGTSYRRQTPSKNRSVAGQVRFALITGI